MGARTFTVVLLLAAAGLVGVGVVAALSWTEERGSGTATAPATGSSTGGSAGPADPATDATTDPSASSTPAPPADGDDAFVVAGGSAGPASAGVAYTVELEAGADAIAGLDAGGFAAFVDAVVLDPRGWAAAVPLRRVDDPAAAQVRVVLATPATVDRLCAPLRAGGRFSCFQRGIVAVNARTWFDGEPASGLDPASSRIQQLNHELGHALGHGDVAACPAAGAPAPVMLQQAVGIGACTPNPWPFP